MDAVQFILHRKTTLAGALLPIPVYMASMSGRSIMEKRLLQTFHTQAYITSKINHFPKKMRSYTATVERYIAFS